MCLQVSGEISLVGKRLPAVLARMIWLGLMCFDVFLQLKVCLKVPLTMRTGKITLRMLNAFMSLQVPFSCQCFLTDFTLERIHLLA